MTSTAQVEGVSKASDVTDVERTMGILATDGPGEINDMKAFTESKSEGDFWDQTTDDDEFEMYRKRGFSASDFKEYDIVNPVQARAAMLYLVRASPSLISVA